MQVPLTALSPPSRIPSVGARDLTSSPPLTGLSSGRFKAALEEMFSTNWWKRGCSIVKIEIDDFEQYAGSEEEQAVDFALFIVGIVLKGYARRNDLAGRSQGGEFIVLLRGAGKRRAVTFAKRVTWDVASQFRDGHTGITVSSGVASQDRSMTHYSQLVELADSALHAAQRRGGNRVAVGYPGAEEVWLPPRPPIGALRSA